LRVDVAEGKSRLADSAAADYPWDCLQDAMDEFRGGPVGLDALRDLG